MQGYVGKRLAMKIQDTPIVQANVVLLEQVADMIQGGLGSLAAGFL